METNTTAAVEVQGDAGVAAPATLPETTAEGQQPDAPKYVTLDEFERKLAESIRRIKQSDRDRSRQIDDKLTAIKTRLEAGGGQLSQQQVSALREQIESDLTPADEAQSIEAKANAKLPPEMQATIEAVYNQIEEVFDDAGARVLPTDPEWQNIQAALEDPKGSLVKTLRAAGKAAEAKNARMMTQKAGAAARVGGAGTSQTGQVQASSSQDYWRNAYKK